MSTFKKRRFAKTDLQGMHPACRVHTLQISFCKPPFLEG